MLVIVVAIFAFCWLPLQTYMVLQDIFPDINKYEIREIENTYSNQVELLQKIENNVYVHFAGIDILI